MNIYVDFSDIPDVLKIADIQKVLQIGRSTAYQLVKTGRLKNIRIGRSIRVPKKYLMEFIEDCHFPLEDLVPKCYDKSVTHTDESLPIERSIT